MLCFTKSPRWGSLGKVVPSNESICPIRPSPSLTLSDFSISLYLFRTLFLAISIRFCGEKVGNGITPPLERPGGREHVGVIISLVQREKNSCVQTTKQKVLIF
eukprot:sb/3478175/